MNEKQPDSPSAPSRRTGGAGRGLADRLPEGTKVVTAFLRTNVPHYVPDGVRVRERISDVMYTAEVESQLLEVLDQDPLIFKVELAGLVYPGSAPQKD